MGSATHDGRETRRRKAMRLLCYALHYGFTQHSPDGDTLPGAALLRRLRYWTIAPMLRRCGKNVWFSRKLKLGLGDRLSIGDNSGLGEGTRIVGDVTIGNDVMMSFNVFITSLNREFSRTEITMNEQADRPHDPVVIEDDVLVLANVMILAGVRIGRGAVIAGGAVVSKNVPRWAVVAGNPARIVKWRKAPEQDALQPNMTPVAKPELDPRCGQRVSVNTGNDPHGREAAEV